MSVSGPALPDQTPLSRTRRARRIGRELALAHSDARCALDFGSPLELLVATILSAQCTDERVNRVTASARRKRSGEVTVCVV